jgi:hypothetical protein
MQQHHPDDVLIDWTGVVVCPYHGPQPGAEWAAGRAPCGCQWRPIGRCGLRAVRGGVSFATEVVPLSDVVQGESAKSTPQCCENPA